MTPALRWAMMRTEWMTENQLKLNDGKPEALLFFSFPFRFPWNLLPFPSLIRLLLALTTSPSLILPGTLDSFLTQNCPRKSTSWKSAKLLISSFNVLVQSAGFSPKTQPRLLLLPICFLGLTTATVFSWVHLILSSSLYKKCKTLLQD